MILGICTLCAMDAGMVQKVCLLLLHRKHPSNGGSALGRLQLRRDFPQNTLKPDNEKTQM